jgi:hypothetical protein
MAKIFDDIMAGNLRIRPPRWIEDSSGVDPKALPRIRGLLRDAVVFDITNVSDYYFGGTDKEWFDPKEDFSCLRPGYSHFWMEASRPPKIRSVLELNPDRMRLPDRVGVLGRVHDMHDAEVMRFTAQQVGVRNKHYAREAGAYESDKFVIEKIGKEILDAEVMLVLTSFVERNRTLYGPMHHSYCWLRENGTLIDYSMKVEVEAGHLGPRPKETDGWENYTYPAMMALDMVHTRNVRVVDVRSPAKLAKKHLKKQGVGSVSWKTITILPYVTRFQVEKDVYREGLGSRQFEILPGHYAHYGMVGPGGWMRGKLFGKIVGRFWIPEHSVGDEANGIILKDYKVESPDKEPPMEGA